MYFLEIMGHSVVLKFDPWHWTHWHSTISAISCLRYCEQWNTVGEFQRMVKTFSLSSKVSGLCMMQSASFSLFFLEEPMISCLIFSKQALIENKVNSLFRVDQSFTKSRAVTHRGSSETLDPKSTGQPWRSMGQLWATGPANTCQKFFKQAFWRVRGKLDPQDDLYICLPLHKTG